MVRAFTSNKMQMKLGIDCIRNGIAHIFNASVDVMDIESPREAERSPPHRTTLGCLPEMTLLRRYKSLE